MTDLANTRLAVVGTGLIGASVGLAAKRAGARHVAGFDSDAEALAAALQRGAVDVGASSLDEAVADAALVVVATPVSSVAACVSEVLEATGECTVTDVGSTKSGICSALASERRFVGGHPLAGSEKHGPQHARADLFEGSRWFLTPLPSTDHERYRPVRDFVSALGAEPVEIDPIDHDRLVALTSHLPHVLANVLLSQAADADALDAVGGSFTDMTRVAGANPRVWTEIFFENATFIDDAIGEFQNGLEDAKRAFRAKDREALSRWTEETARNRPG